MYSSPKSLSRAMTRGTPLRPGMIIITRRRVRVGQDAGPAGIDILTSGRRDRGWIVIVGVCGEFVYEKRGYAILYANCYNTSSVQLSRVNDI